MVGEIRGRKCLYSRTIRKVFGTKNSWSKEITRLMIEGLNTFGSKQIRVGRNQISQTFAEIN